MRSKDWATVKKKKEELKVKVPTTPMIIPLDWVEDTNVGRRYTLAQLKQMLASHGRSFRGNRKQPLVNKLVKIRDSIAIDEEYVSSEDEAITSTNRTIREYKYNVTHRTTTLSENPDLILEVGYFSDNSGLFQKRLVFFEVDGEDKTATSKDAIKLALKIMDSTNVQIPLQNGESYHIRSNFSHYVAKPIELSLMSTTDIVIPNFEDLVRAYQNKSGSQDDYKRLHHGIHFVHHMFVAHVKIAFLILMQVVHGIDLRNTDKTDPRMINNLFFVNFEAQNIPQALQFEHLLQPERKKWLCSKLMMHTRVQIKYWDKESKWVMAPIVNGSSSRSAMASWRAQVRKGPIPQFPYESESAIPVAFATIQRVDMNKIIELVREAAKKANDAYNNAYELIPRQTEIGGVGPRVEVSRRMFPDRCFLSRKDQHTRGRAWNADDIKLRNRRLRKNEDLLEFAWGYEQPEITRKFQNFRVPQTGINSSVIGDRWDQVDVRLYYFNQFMQVKLAEFKDAANGVWYLQDYIDFLYMLQSLDVGEPSSNASAYHFTHLEPPPPAVGGGGVPILYSQCSTALSSYAFQHSRYPAATNPSDLHQFYFNTPSGGATGMPRRTKAADRAYHRFSVLTWFFDCRDGGACRYQWEDHLLEYFGAEQALEAEFDKFVFRRRGEKETPNEWLYFNDVWFEICVFMELNFRNAVAPLHFKIFDTHRQHTAIKGKNGLQETVKALYNRQRSLLNTRALCPGLQGVSPDLSFRMWHRTRNPDVCLHDRIMTQFELELPRLDPFLEEYLKKFNIPDAKLFLRMIRCPNVLALRELAVQHRHLLRNQPTASSAQPDYHIQKSLKLFPIGVQSEILKLFKDVENDDSVFATMPVVHETKRLVLSNQQLRRWVRQTLDVYARVHTLKTPLQMKFFMFTMPLAFPIFKQLFCTSTELDNSHTQRPILFILLQILLALKIMQKTPAEDERWSNEALACTNIPNTETFSQLSVFGYYHLSIFPESNPVPCTIGASLTGWPLRDQNIWFTPQKTADRPRHTVRRSEENGYIPRDGTLRNLKFAHLKPETDIIPEVDRNTGGMLDDEMRRWMLLLYARPTAVPETRADSTVVRQPPEHACTGRPRDTMNIGVAKLYVSPKDNLVLDIHDVPDTYIFMEIFEPFGPSCMRQKQTVSAEAFPTYITSIITDIPDRNLIYIPDVFAQKLRASGPVHDKIFSHRGLTWRMACVGVRAWAWKRLLVKCIFFDSWTKVMTRTVSQLSLYMPVLNPDDQTFTQLKALMSTTKNTLGAMQFKQDRLGPLNEDGTLRPKKIQVMLAVHQHKKRTALVNDEEIDFAQCRVKATDRQLIWTQYLFRHKTTTQSVMSNRFLKLDSRFAGVLLQGEKPHDLTDPSNVLLYRSYLFLTTPVPHLVVAFQNNVYVKFPPEFAVLKSIKQNTAVGTLTPTKEVFFFATIFDCRAYSVARDNFMAESDSDATHQFLWDKDPFLKGMTSPLYDHWRTTAGSVDRRTNVRRFLAFAQTIKADVQPFVQDAFLTPDIQNNMFTLPDLFTPDADKVQKCRDKDKIATDMTYLDDKFLEKLAPLADFDAYRMWSRLRCHTKHIVTVEQDQASGTDGRVLDYANSIDSPPLKTMLETILVRILPKLNEDRESSGDDA